MPKFTNNPIIKMILNACWILGVVTVISFIAGSIMQGRFTIEYVFNTNLIVGVIVIALGILLYLKPLYLSIKRGVIDHSNYGQTFVEKRQEKEQNANEIVLLGITVIVIAGILQLVASWIL